MNGILSEYGQLIYPPAPTIINPSAACLHRCLPGSSKSCFGLLFNRGVYDRVGSGNSLVIASRTSHNR